MYLLDAVTEATGTRVLTAAMNALAVVPLTGITKLGWTASNGTTELVGDADDIPATRVLTSVRVSVLEEEAGAFGVDTGPAVLGDCTLKINYMFDHTNIRSPTLCFPELKNRRKSA